MSWLPCTRCGAWGGGAVCPGCGAARGRLVPLDEGVGDPRLLPRWDGPPGQVQEGLAERAADPALDPDARARLELASRLLDGLPPAASVQAWLDLRPASAGPGVGTPQRDGTRLVRLPWLVLVAGAHEARVVRTAAVRPGLRFRAGRVAPPEGAALDEVSLRGPGGVARRPLRAPARLGELPALDPGVPWPGPLPATAPGQPGGEPGAALAQALVAALLLLFLGLGVERAVAAPAQPDPPARRALLALSDLDPRARREALPGVVGLPPLVQARLLRGLAEQDPDEAVRGLAVELLAARGEVGATCLALAHRGPAPLETRLHALRLLRDLGDPRALDLARRGLATGRGSTRLRAAWAQVVGEVGEPQDLHALLGDPEPAVRAAAGRSLLARAGPAAALSVQAALTRGPRPPPDSDAEAAQAALARALRRVLTPGELSALRAHPALGAPARAALE